MTSVIHIKEIIKELETLAHPALQESYDNAQLLTGHSLWPCTGILTALDCTEVIVEEALERDCNLIVCHHPIIFSGLKSLTGKNYVEKTIIKAIKNDIAIYAVHTNLDNVSTGVNKMICQKLELENLKILSPKKQVLRKLAVMVPTPEATKLAAALYAAGAGQIGDYKDCSFALEGKGTFTPGLATNPTIGKIGTAEEVAETKLEVIFPFWKEPEIITAMKAAHRYEEVAYDIITLQNEMGDAGAGMTGLLENEMPALEFLQVIKKTFGVKHLRYSGKTDHLIKKVAVCGGAGFFLLKDAIRSGADIYITSDVKYHEFFDAENHILLADVGHYESEQYTTELLHQFLSEKFPNFAVLQTKLVTNPVHWI